MSSEQRGMSPNTIRTPENVGRVRLSIQTGDINRPSRLPDLSPPDYFLWAYLKSPAYKERLKDVRNNIQDDIDSVPGDMLEKLTESFQNRLIGVLIMEGDI
ncbi:hypothetical protein TNCV_2471081 [Trichonephila clavipes]|nr:hypothetical protein TNCV_2471081 [Trichonephila clavipes]